MEQNLDGKIHLHVPSGAARIKIPQNKQKTTNSFPVLEINNNVSSQN